MSNLKSKRKGKHTTFITTNFAKKLIAKARKEKSISAINFGHIVPISGKPKKDYLAYEAKVGIELVILGANRKQFVYLYTVTPQKSAEILGLELKAKIS
jgi:hypothetical protein